MFAVLAVYCVARMIPITFVDQTATSAAQSDMQTLMVSMLSGDRSQTSILALGIMPYMTSMVVIMFANAFRSKESRKSTSPRMMTRITILLALVIAILMSINHARDLVFYSTGLSLALMEAIAVIEMVIGSMAVVALIEINKNHGIGQMTPIIVVNMLNSLLNSISGQSLPDLMNPALISVVAIVITLVMELVLVKIPVQRVSIHNNYAESNYIGYKLNPIGLMPVMFSTLLFMVPQTLVGWGTTLWPSNGILTFLKDNLVYTEKLGVLVYLFIILFSAVCFSFLLLSPGDTAENLQRGGDSIVDVHAGPLTARYLRVRLLLLSILSGFVMSVIMALSFSLSLNGAMSVSLAMLPSIAMMLVSFFSTLGFEVVAYGKFDAYKAFL